MKKLLTIILMSFVSAGSLIASENQAEAFDRGVGKMNSVFIPKGYVGGGLNFSYNTIDLGNAVNDPGYSMLFSLLSGISAEMNTLGVSPSVSYFLKDNLAVGFRFDYDRTRYFPYKRQQDV